MDNTSPAAIVNGKSLRMFVGRKVRVIFKVTRYDDECILAITTDGHPLTIPGSRPTRTQLRFGSYMEVLGFADSYQAVRAELWSSFRTHYETLDLENFNELCKLAVEEYKHLFV